MAKAPKISTLKELDLAIPEGPIDGKALRETLRRLFSQLNPYFDSINKLGSKGVTAVENLRCDIIRVTASHGVAIPIALHNIQRVASAVIIGSSVAAPLYAATQNTGTKTATVTVFFNDTTVTGAPVQLLLLEEGEPQTTVPTWVSASGALPAGGVLGQSVVNTGSGTGAWQFPVPFEAAFGRRCGSWVLVGTGSGNFTDSYGVAPTHFGAATYSAVQLVQAVGERQGLQSASITGVNTSCLLNGGLFTTPRQRARMRALIQTPASIATRRVVFAIAASGTSATAPANAASGIKFVRLVYDSAVSANWLLNSGDGTNQSYTDTGLAVQVSTDYYLDLDWTAGTTLTSRIYVGALTNAPTVTNKTTNLATDQTQLLIDMGDVSLTAGTITGFAWSGLTWDTN